jgi:5-(hydroxymethyl)furfural/furfural oxidase
MQVQSVIDCDYLIVGGGTAGSVMARRLTDDAESKVVLVEAGRDIAPDRVPADIDDVFPLSTFNPDYFWPGLKVHWRGERDAAPVGFQQARVMGGGSTVMGMWAVRGMPDDYDGWARSGACGWSWSDVLPHFRKLERDCDFLGEAHGTAGPIPIRRQPRGEWSPLAAAMEKATRDEGFEPVADMNADFRDGYCVLPISRTPHRRASAGLCYLDGATRARANLHIMTNTTVDTIEFDGRRATGATAGRADRSTVSIRAGVTILAAGAVYSPAVLMRSGLGPAAELGAMGVTVLADLPGMGRNLQNHPILPALSMLAPGGRDSRNGRPPASTYLRYSSGQAGAGAGDMGLYIRSYLAWHALGRRMAMVGPVLMRPRSRGRVTLRSADLHDNPKVVFNFLEDSRDLARMMDGLRLTARLMGSAAVAAICPPPFLLENMGRLNRHNDLSHVNAAAARLLTLLLDAWPRAGYAVLGRFARMKPLSRIVADEDLLAQVVLRQIGGTNHVAGTCAMGAADDPARVTDPQGRVAGVERLVVADASIMPTVPSGNTHIPTVMVAEKIAASLARIDA